MIGSSSLRQKMSLATILTILMVMIVVVARIMPTTTMLFFSAAVPVAFGERLVLDSGQSITTVTTNNIVENNATDQHISSLRITQSPQNGLDVECGGDLNCEILDNNTVVATTAATPGQNTTTNAMITSTLNALNQSLSQSLIQSLNQSNILPLPFGDNDFDMLLDDQDLDSNIDKLIDRILNETLGDMQAPLQTPVDLRSASV
jgi:hypothetical protein